MKKQLSYYIRNVIYHLKNRFFIRFGMASWGKKNSHYILLRDGIVGNGFGRVWIFVYDPNYKEYFKTRGSSRLRRFNFLGFVLKTRECNKK